MAADRKRVRLLSATSALILATGFWHGFLADRWGNSTELIEATERATRVMPRLGEWTSEPLPIDAKALRLAEVTGYLSRMYTNETTGEQVSILLICGRPGPIGVHTPDICYEGAGYQMGVRSEATIEGILPEPAGFWSGFFYKGRDPAPLHILWAWKDGPSWRAPASPRLSFH